MNDPVDSVNKRLTKRILDQNYALAENTRQFSQMALRSIISEIHKGEFLYTPSGQSHTPTHRPVDPTTLFHPSELTGFKPLHVPLGKIAWVEVPDLLPNIGIMVPDVDANVLQNPLLSLMSQHHVTPFGKLVFLVENLNIVPFLSRYGFCTHRCSLEELSHVRSHLEYRYGLSEIRNLIDGRQL